MEEKFYVLGFDIGGTKLGIGLASSEGELLGKDRIENKDTHPDDILPLMVIKAKELIASANLELKDIKAFGISAPFPADPVRGIMTKPSNNPKWRDVPILDYLEKNLGIKGYFENDANCAALAEWYFGAGRGCTDFLYLTMSTGIGGGVIAANRLIRGEQFCAGEIGHMVLELDGRECVCGLKGCYEAYCGGRAIAMRLQEELKDQPNHPIVQFAGGKIEDIDMIALEKAVRAKDEYAMAIWDEMARRNAQAFGLFLSTFNPQRLVLGTFAWAAGELFMEPIRKYLPEFAWQPCIDCCELVPSELRRDIGYYAGPALALYGLKSEND